MLHQRNIRDVLICLARVRGSERKKKKEAANRKIEEKSKRLEEGSRYTRARHPASFIDMTGQRFGWLIVEARASKDDCGGRHAYWLCRCDCGNETVVRASNLRSENTKSCGCFPRGPAASGVQL